MKKSIWIAVFSIGVLVASDKPDLLGSWQYAPDQASTSGPDSTPSTVTIAITKKGKMVHMMRRTTVGNDEKVVESDCRSDGKYHPVLGTEGGSIKCKWEGNTLVTDRQWGDGQNHEHMMLTLSPDGTTITEQVHSELPSGASDNTLVLKRQ